MDYKLIPMLPKGVKQGDLSAYSPEYYAWEEKFDGWRLVVHRTAEGIIKVYGGRNGSDYTGQLKFIEEALMKVLPLDTVIDGEVIGKEDWGSAQTAMTTHGYDRDDMVFVMFDVLRVAGEDVRHWSWTNRRKLLEKINVDASQLRRSTILGTEGVPEDYYFSPFLYLFEQVVERGGEGIVLKLRSANYVNGRSSCWVKCKKVETVDARVIGFKDGELGGKFDGMIGSFIVELINEDGSPGPKTTVKCGDDARHRDVTDNQDKWMGKVLELSHNGLGKSGVPRHPQVFHVRDDRTPSEAPKVVTPPQTNGATPIAPREAPVRPQGGRRRNYAGMDHDKLLRSIEELREGRGEAWEKAMAKGHDPAEDLVVAEAAARKKGLINA